MNINIRKNNLIYPYFVIEGKNKKQEIKNFPGVYRFSIDRLLKDIVELRLLGVNKILLFGIPREKDDTGLQAYRHNDVAANAVSYIKKEFNDLQVITDVCLCAYTKHGHCGILKSQVARSQSHKTAEIDNAKTLRVLSDIALSYADAGADIVAPSAMAKNQVGTIRKALDNEGHKAVRIMGYSAKFASNFYGPFRQAANSAPKFGDRSGYQLNFRDPKTALKEITQDIKEGADIVMVKPALSYLDVIKEASLKFDFPLAAYNVSGEYTLIKYGAAKKLWDEKRAVFEVITAIKRAGADLIISYHTKDIARWLNGQ